MPGPGARLCSSHFKDANYEQSQILKIRLMLDEKFKGPSLKPGVVPTIRTNEKHRHQVPVM